jgi:hypothetical protein
MTERPPPGKPPGAPRPSGLTGTSRPLWGQPAAPAKPAVPAPSAPALSARPTSLPAAAPSAPALSARPMPLPAPPPRAPAFAPPAPPAPPLPSTANPFAEVSNVALSLVVDSRIAEEEPPGLSQEPMRALTPIELEELQPPPPWVRRARRLARRGWPVLAAGLAAAIALAIFGGGHRARLPAAVITAPAPAEGPTAAELPAAAEPPAPGELPAPAELPAPPAPAAAVPDPRSAGCTVRVTSRPRGALVTLGRDRLGRTPLAAASIPCGKVRLSISHPRFRSASYTVRAVPDSPARARVQLRRPGAQLQLVSVPAGALFKINGRPVGASPARVTVPRYRTVRLEAVFPGRAGPPWRQTLYVRRPVTKVQARPGR